MKVSRSHQTIARALSAILAVLLLVGAGSATATVRAWFDRSSVGMGETVTLNVESGDASEPDFSVLEKDFRIAGRSTNSQVQIINGAMARTNLWAVALEPLHEGVITVPPIPVGSDQTAPLTLTVQPMARGSAAKGDDVFLEVEVDTTTPYVQQQVAYTVRLFYAVSLLEGNLDDPTGDGLQVRRVGEDVNYSRQIGARRYNVVERRYAISAERSGEVSIRGVTFRGRVAGAGRLNSFFNQGAPLTTGSEAIVLDVRAAPAGAPMPWVPAQSLRLTDDAARLPAQAKVGDVLELTLSVEASGLAAEQIPELALPPIADADVYPDQETRETQNVDGRIVGRRASKFAIVPQRAGTLELPERSLSWWNVTTDQAQRSTLPARALEILPGAAGNVPVVAAPGAESHVTSTLDTSPSPPSYSYLWQGLAILFAVAWLTTLALWRWRARVAGMTNAGPAVARTEPVSMWRPALAHALVQGDLAAARRALLRLRPGLRDLGALAALLQDGAQRDAVRALDRVLYRGDAGEGLVERLRTAFAKTPAFRDATTSQGRNGPQLAPLYPVASHNPPRDA